MIKNQGGSIDFKFPFLPDVQPSTKNGLQQYLNRIWRPQLTLIGISGVPPTDNAGNVLRPSTTFGLSIRLPPTLSYDEARKVVETFFKNERPLYDAKVELLNFKGGSGFCANPYKESTIQKLN